MTKVSQKTSPDNNSEIVQSESDKEKSKERYLSPEERQKNIDDMVLR